MQVDNLSILLSKYFGLSGKVFIPGIGLLSRFHSSAINYFIDKKYAPPSYSVALNRNEENIPPAQLHYLNSVTGVASLEIQDALHQLGKTILSLLQNDRKLEWIGIGHFHMDDDGVLSFQQKISSIPAYREIHYQHVIRKDAEHAMTVGAEEKTSVEMEEFFEEQRKGRGWKIWQKMALLIFLISVIIVFVRFSMGNFAPFGPTLQKLNPRIPSATYTPH